MKKTNKELKEDTCNIKLIRNPYAEFLKNAYTSIRKNKISKDTSMYDSH